MIQDISEHEFPNGGWAFRQATTGWTNPMALVGFRASVEAIIKHRLANRATTAKHNLATDYNVVADELKKYHPAPARHPRTARPVTKFFSAPQQPAVARRGGCCGH